MKYNGEQYLRAEHLLKDGRYIEATAKIAAIVDDCPIKRGDKDGSTIGLKFERSDKVFGLNRTNFSLCCWELGDGSPAHWVGKSITLVVRLVRNKKLVEPAIRVWPKSPHPNIRVRDQMGEDVTEEWYKQNCVAVGGIVIEAKKG